MSTATDSRLVVHEPTINSEFLREYLETLLGIQLKCVVNNSKLQIFEIESTQPGGKLNQFHTRRQGMSDFQTPSFHFSFFTIDDAISYRIVLDFSTLS